MNHLLKQYSTIKEKYKDAVLLFRVGDFYETFNEDAEILSRPLGNLLVLTEQDPNSKASVSLPHYTLATAFHKLAKAGHKVGICEQLEAPKRGPMKQCVTEVLAPEKFPHHGKFRF